jgi:pyruvate formate-lyase activating enzyme-like uncharacterized protein
MTMQNKLPSDLQRYLEKSPENNSQLIPDDVHSIWEKHTEKVKSEAPYAVIEDGGASIYLGKLSPGCIACKSGSWDCFFLTMSCNLTCPFCCSRGAASTNIPLSALGKDIDEVLEHLNIIKPAGISFSGGEPFLEFEKLRNLVSIVRRELPGTYLWVYTNGFLAAEEKIIELGKCGINEIRFNLAASGYDNPTILDHLYASGKWIETTTVEIPSIPEQKNKLLSLIPKLDLLGVQFLNLHELIYEPGTPSESLSGPRFGIRTPDGHYTEIHPDSRQLTLEVIQYTNINKLNVSVNDCSLQNKIHQVIGRRKLIGRLFANLPNSIEALDENGFLCTVCVVNEKGEYFFIHPDDLFRTRNVHPEYRCIYLKRIPPLSVFAPRRWFLCS